MACECYIGATPRLRVKSYEELNAWLLDQCVAYARAHRHPELRDQTIWSVFEAERTVVTVGQIILAADVSTEANDVRQLTPMVEQAQANVAAVVSKDAELGAVVADAGYWSEANAATETEHCELFIATQKDHKQRAALRDAPPPRGRKPKNMTRRERMERKLRTKRGRACYRRRGACV